MSEPEQRRDDIEGRAAEWVIRLGGDPLTPEERRTLDRWLTEHPDHRAAFDFACSTWSGLAALRPAPGALAADIVSPLSHRSRARVWMRAGALAASILIAIGLGVRWLGDPLTMLVADYRTAPAEMRTVTLPDGSRMDLGPASAVALRFNDQERRVELLAGVIHVDVAPMAGSEDRPFVVEAAGGTVTALGTRFVVDRTPDAIEVTVTEHRGEVAATPAGEGSAWGAGETVVLSPGQSVRYGDAGFGAIADVNPEHATAWRRGRLVFDRAPLAEVAAELNRYRHGRIVIADAALGERRVSGVFEAARLDEALASIARELGAHVADVPPFVTLLY